MFLCAVAVPTSCGRTLPYPEPHTGRAGASRWENRTLLPSPAPKGSLEMPEPTWELFLPAVPRRETLDASRSFFCVFFLLFVVFAVSLPSPPLPRLFPAQFGHVRKSKSGASNPSQARGQRNPQLCHCPPVPPVPPVPGCPQLPKGFTWRFCPEASLDGKFCLQSHSGWKVLPPSLFRCEYLPPQIHSE